MAPAIIRGDEAAPAGEAPPKPAAKPRSRARTPKSGTSGDKGRGAPMFVGRLQATPAQPSAPGPIAELQNLTRRDGFVLIFVLLFAYVIVRGIFQVRRALAPRRALSASTRSLANDEIAPGELADWLRSLPDDEDQGPDDADPPRR